MTGDGVGLVKGLTAAAMPSRRPDRPPMIWTEAEMGRAIFSYEGVVDQRFMTVHS